MLFTGLQGISVASPWMLWAVGSIFRHLVGSQDPSRTMRGLQAPPGLLFTPPDFPGTSGVKGWASGSGAGRQALHRVRGYLQTSRKLP